MCRGWWDDGAQVVETFVAVLVEAVELWERHALES